MHSLASLGTLLFLKIIIQGTSGEINPDLNKVIKEVASVT